jgi:anti-anti-sigma factor
MTDQSLTIQSRAGKATGQRIVQVSGRLDLATASTFLEQIRVETAPVVILDLTDVQSADSSGVGALAQIYKSFKLENRRLAVVGLNNKVRYVLEITHVLKVLTVFANLTEAEEALI